MSGITPEQYADLFDTTDAVRKAFLSGGEVYVVED